MEGISSAFKTAIAAGYRIATACYLVQNGVHTGQLALLGGQVQVSRSDQTRSRCSLSISVDDLSLVPGPQLTGVLAPFGAEIELRAGITYPSGSQELVQLGVFAISDVQVSDTGADLQISLTGMDRSWVVAQRKLKTPYSVANGTNVATAITGIIASVYSPLVTNIAPTTATVPAVQFKEGDDPWVCAMQVAASAGYEIWFDRFGVLVARPIPNPLGTATSWAYSDGPTGTLRSLTRTLTRQGVSNDFIVSGSGSNVQPPVRAGSADNDANSVTYVSGNFGDVPTFVESSLVSTTAQAQSYADNLLAAAKGGIEKLDIDVIPNPAHDVDDVISVQRNRAGVNGLYVIDTISHTLGHGGSTALGCRRVR